MTLWPLCLPVFFWVFSFSILIFWQFEFAIFVLWGTQGETALTSAGKKCKCSDNIIYLKFWIFINIFFLFVSLHSEWDHRQRHVPVPQPVVARPLRQSPATRKSCHFLTLQYGPRCRSGCWSWWKKGVEERRLLSTAEYSWESLFQTTRICKFTSLKKTLVWFLLKLFVLCRELDAELHRLKKKSEQEDVVAMPS